ncbi:hypothetical protein SYN63AY4M2_00905 [Synechococcus sp. 63AY4M2]|nr:hypothetical protein CYA_1390 [Synechococcus sp. JA-3-3Ab]PIK87334.1 hypothetical protein SYN63AY4M2_00905 [Synechococcus sp. 63AY4M2]PIK89706.1 hypothetical protein SYN65AY6A5_04585 [Synechococcus sp. 65AY6A5]PIK93267.1 hypothetical protein SYN65AY6LI_11765 [Synechococcus sp. 65AY6Li]PIK96346.1 hypothetical protein SYN60AY4M2_01325 [Synechococcus sp. 60AY4M2]PIK99188.1 hypothetical protein SYN63AY4M1_12275 [Synechococcus sp. 63AY4M1]PIL02368.1 hypothetical protein SYN65AY640_01745 [Synech
MALSQAGEGIEFLGKGFFASEESCQENLPLTSGAAILPSAPWGVSILGSGSKFVQARRRL